MSDENLLTNKNDENLPAIKKKVERLIYMAAGGKLSHEDLEQHDADLRQVGLDSLGYLNLLEGLERAFGVAIEIEEEEDHTFLHTINNLASYLAAQDALA